MPEWGTLGSVRGDASNGIPYRDDAQAAEPPAYSWFQDPGDTATNYPPSLVRLSRPPRFLMLSRMFSNTHRTFRLWLVFRLLITVRVIIITLRIYRLLRIVGLRAFWRET